MLLWRRSRHFGVRQLAAAFPSLSRWNEFVSIVTLTKSGSKLPHSKAAATAAAKQDERYIRVMKMKAVYLLLCVVGTVLPYWQFIPFLQEHGLDLRALVQQLFANHASSFFTLDVVVATVVLWVFVAVDGRRTGVRHLWAPIAASLAVGVSLGLPLFLFLREQRLEAE